MDVYLTGSSVDTMVDIARCVISCGGISGRKTIIASYIDNMRNKCKSEYLSGKLDIISSENQNKFMDNKIEQNDTFKVLK